MIKDWPIAIAGAFAFVISMIAIVLSILGLLHHYDAKLVVTACLGLAALVVAKSQHKLEERQLATH